MVRSSFANDVVPRVEASTILIYFAKALVYRRIKKTCRVVDNIPTYTYGKKQREVTIISCSSFQNEKLDPTAPKAEVFGAQAIVDNQFFWTLMSYWQQDPSK